MEIPGAIGKLTFALTIKRADTGNIETYNCVGYITDKDFDNEDLKDVNNSLDNCEKCSD